MNVSAKENEDSRVILSFSIHSYPHHHSLVYKHNGRPIEFDTRVVALNNGSAIIQAPMKSDAGQYTLEIKNALGNASSVILLIIFCESMHVGVRYTLLQIFISDAPEIRGFSNNSFIAQIDRTADISCGSEVRSLPLPTFHWSYQDNDGFRRNIPAGRFFFNPDEGVLTIDTAQYEDSGTYICTASNSVGRSSVVVNLLVLGIIIIVAGIGNSYRRHSKYRNNGQALVSIKTHWDQVICSYKEHIITWSQCVYLEVQVKVQYHSMAFIFRSTWTSVES